MIHSIYKNQQSLKEQEATQEQGFLLPFSTPTAPSIEELTSSSLSSQQVFLFLHRCIHFLLPKSLLGSKRNWRRFFSALRVFVQSQSRDTFPVSAFTTGMDLSSIRWLAVEGKPSPATACVSQTLFQAMICFLLTTIIVCTLLVLSIDSSSVRSLLHHRHHLRLPRASVLPQARVRSHRSR